MKAARLCPLLGTLLLAGAGLSWAAPAEQAAPLTVGQCVELAVRNNVALAARIARAWVETNE